MILQGYESKTQPREFYEKAREYIPNAKEVMVRDLQSAGHFWSMESPEGLTGYIRELLQM